jgi:hypothetical protein
MPRTERARAVAATSVDAGEGQRNPLASPSLSPLPSVNPTHRHNGRRSESCRPVPTALSPFRLRRRTRSSPCRQHKLTHLLSAQRSNQARLGQALPAALAQGPNRQLSRRLQEAQRRRPPQARPAPGAGPDRPTTAASSRTRPSSTTSRSSSAPSSPRSTTSTARSRPLTLSRPRPSRLPSRPSPTSTLSSRTCRRH